MGESSFYIITVVLLMLFGGIFYLLTNHFLRKLPKKADAELRDLWIWRGFVSSLILFSAFFFVINWDFFNSFFFAIKFLLYTTLVIYFVALIEIVVIDLILPIEFSMKRRIVAEIAIFIALIIVTWFISFYYTLFIV